MTEPALSDVLANLHQTQQSFLEILSQASDEVLYHRPGDDDWILAEVLVHIAEARQFFAGETQKALATPGAGLGRTLDDPHRLKNVEEHGHDPPDAIRRKLIASHESLLESLAQVTDDDLQIEVEHINFGPQTLGEFIQRFMVGHDRIHVEQATALLARE
jgi:uncharacterized damage-inducible protein DinB